MTSIIVGLPNALQHVAVQIAPPDGDDLADQRDEKDFVHVQNDRGVFHIVRIKDEQVALDAAPLQGRTHGIARIKAHAKQIPAQVLFHERMVDETRLNIGHVTGHDFRGHAVVTDDDGVGLAEFSSLNE